MNRSVWKDRNLAHIVKGYAIFKNMMLTLIFVEVRLKSVWNANKIFWLEILTYIY